MGKEGNTNKANVAVPIRQKPLKAVSRRAFIKGLGAVGVGSVFFSAGVTERARGQPVSAYIDGLSTGQLIAMYTDMLKIRLWETKIKDLALKGGFRGVAHLYVGEEAIAVGVCSALRKDDYIASTHRGHGHLIAKGGDLKLMLAEITHKATGYCKGYGGSLHITDMSLGILGDERYCRGFTSARGRSRLRNQGQGNGPGGGKLWWRWLHTGKLLHQCRKQRCHL